MIHITIDYNFIINDITNKHININTLPLFLKLLFNTFLIK